MNTNEYSFGGSANLPIQIGNKPPDPILLVIQQFRVGLASFNAMPSCENQEEELARVAQTFGPAMDALETWDQPVQSHEGAVEALRLAVEENAGSAIAVKMVIAALGYFDQAA